MLKSYQLTILCGVVLVAGIYSAHGERWQEEMRDWVLSENRSPKIVKDSDTQPKTGISWPEYYRQLLQDES